MPSRDGLISHRDMGNGSVRTRIIGDQQVDITRTLEPVYVATLRDDNSTAVALSTDNSTGTRTIICTTTHAIPSWVGTLDIYATGYCRFNTSTQEVFNYIRFSTSAYGSQVAFNSVSADTFTAAISDRYTASSPGATVNVTLRGVSESTYSVSIAHANLNTMAIGIR